MDADRWTRLEALCAEALEQNPEDRVAWITAACAEDATLRVEALSLLEQLDRDPGFLEAPVASLQELFPPPPDAGLEEEPHQIGSWNLLRPLGRGGMGTVWLAEREVEGIRQQVALKLVRLGMDTEDVLDRFRLERRILGALDHPNIARLLDAAATPDGRPYLVMEYVDGVPVTEHADREELSVPARLELMLTICTAVDHAHRHLVVHRDLKPRNIFVTGDGTVKLLDFGIGKVLGASEVLGPVRATHTRARLLTPEYAAPEQVTGGPITTATDVYGLGLLLCELLTGRHPLLSGGEALAEIEEATLHRAPTAPSQLTGNLTGRPGSATRRRIPRDLDMIILKALRKEPDRRYPTAADLADDLRRHLSGHPVTARPDTIGYRVRRFVRRNAAPVTAAAAVLLALVATTTVTLVQSRRVAAESARVAAERDKALEVRGFLMEMFGATGAGRAVGDTVTVRRLLDLQTARLDTEPWSPELRAEMLAVLADGYDRLGLWEEAEPLAIRSLDLRRDLFPSDHPDVAASLNLVGWIAHERGRSHEAVPLLHESIGIRRALGRRGESDLSRSLNDLGVIWNALGHYDSAQMVLEESLAIRDRLFGPGHRSVGITANNLAAAHWFQSNVADAAGIQERALQALQQSVGPDHQRTIIALSNLATFRVTAGDLAGAERDYRDLLARQERLQGPDHPVTSQVRLSLATVLTQQGGSTPGDPRLDEAERQLQLALRAYESRLGAEHVSVGETLDRLSDLLLARHRPTEALPLAERAVAILRRTRGLGHRATANALAGLASAHWRLGHRGQALRFQRNAVAGFEASPGPDHPETGQAQGVLCDFLLASGRDLLEAEQLCTHAAEVVSKGPAGFHQMLPFLRLRQATANYRMQRPERADSIVAVARGEVERGLGGAEARRLLDSVTAGRGGVKRRR